MSERSEHTEWLAGLKAGDEVAVFQGYCDDVPTLKLVDRVTRTQVLTRDERYRRATGRPYGDRYSPERIAKPTAAHRSLIESRDLRKALSETVSSEATHLATLRAMAACIEAGK